MKTRTPVTNGLAIACISLGVFSSAVTGNSRSAAHAHIGHVADAWQDTPGKQGLLPTAKAEAQIAAQHAELAAKDPSSLERMQLHAGHVLHAVDPEEIASGPGLGYGVRKAASGVVAHIKLAADAEDASRNVTMHATHVRVSAQNTLHRADEIVTLAKKIQTARSLAEAGRLVAQLNTLSQQLITGEDRDGDGRVGWQQGEGGLQQAEEHMNLMKEGEGLP